MIGGDSSGGAVGAPVEVRPLDKLEYLPRPWHVTRGQCLHKSPGDTAALCVWTLDAVAVVSTKVLCKLPSQASPAQPRPAHDIIGRCEGDNWSCHAASRVSHFTGAGCPVCGAGAVL